jgi:2,3-bisphosphoglycerate-independent phosphoglycerate mutase
VTLRAGGRLADVAPTILEIMGLPQPEEMTGRSLIVAPSVGQVIGAGSLRVGEHLEPNRARESSS